MPSTPLGDQNAPRSRPLSRPGARPAPQQHAPQQHAPQHAQPRPRARYDPQPLPTALPPVLPTPLPTRIPTAYVPAAYVPVASSQDDGPPAYPAYNDRELRETATMAYLDRREDAILQVVREINSLSSAVLRLNETVARLDGRVEALDTGLRTMQTQRAGDAQRLEDHAARITNVERTVQDALRALSASQVHEAQDFGRVQQTVQQSASGAQHNATISSLRASESLSKFKDVVLGALGSATIALLLYVLQHPR